MDDELNFRIKADQLFAKESTMDPQGSEVFVGVPFAQFAEDSHEFDVFSDFATSDMADLRLARMYKRKVEEAAELLREKDEPEGEVDFDDVVRRRVEASQKVPDAWTGAGRVVQLARRWLAVRFHVDYH